MERDKMCEYCKECNRGNDEGITSLNITNIPMGIFEDGYVELEMSVYEEETKMIAWFTHDNYNISASCKIEYCPFCGRKLNEKEK